MLSVTIDLFSGRPNPSCLLQEDQALPLLKEIALHRGILARQDQGFQGLGFRAVEFQFTSDDDAERYQLPDTFRIAHGVSDYEAKALEIAERASASMLSAATAQGGPAATAFDKDLHDFVVSQLDWAPSRITSRYPEAVDEVDEARRSSACYIERGKFNPAFWNGPDYVRRNNCYNYASNRRTNTFAQPGRASGAMYTALTCPAVTAAALADGLHKRFNCFPESESPRWLMALVVAPNRDYHWYRQALELFWGHKPGGTEARNTDNSNQVIWNPETADRGPYTDFCGYFYACRSQRIA